MEISCQEVAQLLQIPGQTQLLDCREQDEYDLVHLADAILVPMSELQDRVEELSEWKDESLVVYCHHGMRSLRVAHWLVQQGFTNVKSMTGGIDQWASEIDPSLTRY